MHSGLRPSLRLSPLLIQSRSSRICHGELTAQWRVDQYVGNILAQLKAARRVNHRDVIHDYPDLISGDSPENGSAELLLTKIQEEREKLKSKKKMTRKKNSEMR